MTSVQMMAAVPTLAINDSNNEGKPYLDRKASRHCLLATTYATLLNRNGASGVVTHNTQIRPERQAAPGFQQAVVGQRHALAAKASTDDMALELPNNLMTSTLQRHDFWQLQ